MQAAVLHFRDPTNGRLEDGAEWSEFLNVDSLSMGVYRVAAGTDDEVTHQPHDRDEVYVVVEGRGRLTVAGQASDVVPRSVIFVRAQAEHHFHDVTENLVLLVFFAGPKP
jgi:mannose-6-phosphate isomerase-like protein (cupin superfamily)